MSGKAVAIIGSGVVGETLANGFLKYGFKVCRASRDPSKLSEWLSSAEPKGQVTIGTFKEACKCSDIVVLATAGPVWESVLEQCGLDNLKGKVIIDATNPISGGAEDGVLEFFAGVKDSLMEKLQEKVPEGKFVKAWNCVGFMHFVDPDFGNDKPTMFICGNDASAKEEVSTILEMFGWEVADMGTVKAARAIEPLCQLWCIPAYLGKETNYAFKLLKQKK